LHSTARVESFAASLVQVYRRIKDQFAAATQTHYAFSTRDLITWILALMRYQFTGKLIKQFLILTSLLESNVHSLLGHVSAFEARRIFRDRLINIEHCQLFDNILVDTFGSDPTHVFAPIQGAFLWNSAAAVMGKPMERTERQAYQTQLAKNVKRYGKFL
jgi:dynein heavy chain 2